MSLLSFSSELNEAKLSSDSDSTVGLPWAWGFCDEKRDVGFCDAKKLLVLALNCEAG